MSDTERIRNGYRFAYAWRTRDDPGDTDLSELRTTLTAEFDAWLKKVKADAFDEGVRAWGETMVPILTCKNPYRDAPDA